VIASTDLQAKSSLKRTQEERDNFARQFEKLSTVNANDEEIAFGKYKEKAEARAKGRFRAHRGDPSSIVIDDPPPSTLQPRMN
jgi:hypothetical protein